MKFGGANVWTSEENHCFICVSCDQLINITKSVPFGSTYIQIYGMLSVNLYMPKTILHLVIMKSAATFFGSVSGIMRIQNTFESIDCHCYSLCV